MNIRSPSDALAEDDIEIRIFISDFIQDFLDHHVFGTRLIKGVSGLVVILSLSSVVVGGDLVEGFLLGLEGDCLI